MLILSCLASPLRDRSEIQRCPYKTTTLKGAGMVKFKHWTKFGKVLRVKSVGWLGNIYLSYNLVVCFVFSTASYFMRVLISHGVNSMILQRSYSSCSFYVSCGSSAAACFDSFSSKNVWTFLMLMIFWCGVLYVSSSFSVNKSSAWPGLLLWLFTWDVPVSCHWLASSVRAELNCESYYLSAVTLHQHQSAVAGSSFLFGMISVTAVVAILFFHLQLLDHPFMFITPFQVADICFIKMLLFFRQSSSLSMARRSW